jgi:hypothetical protein
MLRSAVLAGLFMMLAPNTAVAQDAGGTEAAPTAPEKKICRRVIATGSVMAKVTCHTKAEWDAIAAKGQSDLERGAAQDRARAMIQQQRPGN